MKLDSIREALRPYSILRERQTTIAHAFASAIALSDEYDSERVAQALRSLGQDPDGDLMCVYCEKAPAKTWDHVYGLVRNKQYSGFGHVLGNLVPCCMNCNESKGNRDWSQFLKTRIHEEKRLDTKMEPTKANDLMDAALDMTGKEIASHGIEITKDYSPVPAVMALPTNLQQVFINLLNNARDAMPKGGTIALRCWAADGHVSCSVKDSGTGIPKALQSRLFEPFFTTKDVGEGTGLGLYMCHRIVSELKGSITINSEEGKGTEVVVRLPIQKVEAPVAAGRR